MRRLRKHKAHKAKVHKQAKERFHGTSVGHEVIHNAPKRG
jgi:hypothetical protein